MDGLYLNNIGSETYGITFLEGSYRELQKPAAVKAGLQQKYPDENGTERDVVSRYLESRTLILPCLLEGDSEADFIEKHQAFFDLMQSLHYFDLRAERINQEFRLLYLEATDYRDYNDHATFNLVVVDDYPHTGDEASNGPTYVDTGYVFSGYVI